MNYKLSIVVLTMNRAEQLGNALVSCFNCKLPKDTEFVIVDNASSDNTSDIVCRLFDKYKYPYKYIKEDKNRGVGGGRNIGFENSEGEFCYFLDDDAIIASECYETFFTLPISHFENDRRISSITTRIYDEALKFDRGVIFGKEKETTLPTIFMYLGGSHFLRKEYYHSPIYIDIKYGHEEIIPSIYAIDNGFLNCYINEIRIIHQPKINKWEEKTDLVYEISSNADANILASKILIYPVIVHPILYLSLFIRLIKHFGLKIHWYKKCLKKYKNITRNSKFRKIKIKTFLHIAKNYSIGSAI